MERRHYFRGLGLGIVVTALIMGFVQPVSGKRREMTDDEVIARAKQLGMIEDESLLEAEKQKADGDTASPETDGTKKNPAKLDVAVADEEAAQRQGEAAKDQAAASAADDDPEKPETQAAEAKPQAQDSGEKAQGQTAAKASAQNETANASSQGQAAKPQAQDVKPQGQQASQTAQKKGENEMTKPDAAETEKESAEESIAITISPGDGSYTVAKKLSEAGLVSAAGAYDTFLCENGYDKKLRTGTFHIPAGADGEAIARIVTGPPQ